MIKNLHHPRAMLALFAAGVLAAGLMAMVGAKPAWAAEPNFEPAKNYTIDSRVLDLTAADFDGDGNAADLAVATQGSTTADTLGNVAVLSNEGDGIFAAARNVPAGIGPNSVTSADFDRDGREDLAVANGSANVSISLSNGDETFQAAKYFPVGSGAVQVTTAHFNDDGAVDFVDLAVASLGSDSVSVLLGNGDGTFRAAKNFEVGDAPVSVTSGDFNGDGKADLATADDPYNPASGNIADGVSVLLGNGDGTFEDAWRFGFSTGPNNHANPQQVVSADFDGDGRADLAVANHGGGDFGGSGCCNPGYVRVLLSDGDGTFSAGQYLGNAPDMKRPDSLTTADFDRDGIADLASAQENLGGPGVVAVSLGNGDGTFNAAKPFTADGYPTCVISEDLNDDNYPDLAVLNREASPDKRLLVLLNIPPPGATTSTSGSSGTAGEPQPSFQVASSETNARPAGSSAAAAGSTTRISVDASGAQLKTSSSGSASISSDGRHVVFTSTSPDLVPNDTNDVTDVFVRDRTTGTTRRVSVDSSGIQGNATSLAPFISADGRFVAFSSRATNLVANDTNNVLDVFVRDRDTDADGIFDEAGATSTERVNVSSSGTQGNNIDSFPPRPSISADGRYVAFASLATNLVANDTNGVQDVFVRDRTTGTTQRVSVSSSVTQTDRRAFGPSISADGRFVAFSSRATNLVANDTNSAEDVFVRDRTTGTTRRVSVDSPGNQASGACNEFACEGSSVVSISSNGRYVAFNSSAFNLVANDTNDLNDIFVRDRDTDADGVLDETGAASTERANVAGCASQANRGGFAPFISSDGRYVAFSSQSTNLVANDTNVSPDFFVRDRTTGTTQRVSVSSFGTQSHLGGDGSSISSDGRFAAFSSQSLDLVADDTNGFADVFLRELGDAPQQPNDCIAPLTNASASTDGAPYETGAWTKDNVELTLDARDEEGGSGVKDIRYSATGADATSEQTVPAADLPATFTIDAEGTTTIRYFATDNAGNRETPTKRFAVKIDRSAPAAPLINSPANNSFDLDGTITLSGTAEENATVEVFETAASGDASEGTTRADASGPWTKTLSGVSNGSHTYKAKATDEAGNTSEFSNTRTVVVDTIKPRVLSTTPTPGATGVLPGANITATFSEAMRASSLRNPTTLRSTAFTLARKNPDGTTTAVAAKVSYDAATKKATLDPDAALVRRVRYVVTVTSGAKDTAGNALDQNHVQSGEQPKTWTFTVRP